MLATRVARADDDRAAAEALYEIGQTMMKDGKFAEACPKLEASNALDPGIGTLLLLGDCDEKIGKVASAWAAFQDAAGLAKARNDSERLGIANLRAAALKPRLTYVEFRVPREDDLSGFELRRGGRVVGKGSWGVPLPIDSGNYEITASAPDRERWHTSIEVPASADQPIVVQIPVLAKQAASAPSASTVPVTTTSVPAPGPDHPASSGTTQRVLGAVLATAGVAALATAGVFAFMANQRNKESLSDCENGRENFCNPQGVATRKTAQNFAKIATFLDIGAGVGIVSGAVIYFTAPSDEKGRPAGMTVGLHGRF
jgi:hypothetical protein